MQRHLSLLFLMLLLSTADAESGNPAQSEDNMARPSILYHGKRIELNEYERTICTGYKLIRNNSTEVVLCKSASTQRGKVLDTAAVGGNIILLAMKMPYITGCVSPLATDTQRERQKHTGYFLVNTDTGLALEGLKHARWQEELARIDWADVKLLPPQ